jgi:hypothetical protein
LAHRQAPAVDEATVTARPYPAPRRIAASVETAAEQLAAVVDEVFTSLGVLVDALADRWRARAVDGSLSPADLAALQPVVFTALRAHHMFDGAGYVLAEGTLRGRRRELDWWHPEDGGHYRPLVLELEVGAPDCYDYY